VATVVFLLDGKLVLLRPLIRKEGPVRDLKYDMRVLSDRVEYFLLLAGSGDEPPMSTLKGSIWAWDGTHLKVSHLCKWKLTADLVIASQPRPTWRVTCQYPTRLLSLDYPHIIWYHCRVGISSIESEVCRDLLVQSEIFGISLTPSRG